MASFKICHPGQDVQLETVKQQSFLDYYSADRFFAKKKKRIVYSIIKRRGSTLLYFPLPGYIL